MRAPLDDLLATLLTELSSTIPEQTDQALKRRLREFHRQLSELYSIAADLDPSSVDTEKAMAALGEARGSLEAGREQVDRLYESLELLEKCVISLEDLMSLAV